MPRLTDEQRLVMEGLIACARGTESYLNDYDALRAALARCDEADAMETALREACDLASLPESSWDSGKEAKLAELRALLPEAHDA